MSTILITGFGPFPGAPFNPTIEMVRGLARLRRPVMGDVKIVGHVFETSYASVDHDLPALIATHKPDAMLMFGLATRAKAIRIETRARNALALLPDASSKALRRSVIAGDGPMARAMPAPHRRLLAAALSAQVPAHLSRDAGRYLCNYACWRAVEAVDRAGGPRLASFVHVPLTRRTPRPLSVKQRKKGPDSRFRGNDRNLMRRHSFTSADLLRAGARVLVEMVSALRR
jgi:pyroglutamyl-peptidase